MKSYLQNLHYFADNFHLYFDGTHNYLQVYNNSGIKFQHLPTDGCSQNITTSDIGSEIYVTPSQHGHGVMLSVKNSNDVPFYLRVNILDDYVELVCQEHVNNVS